MNLSINYNNVKVADYLKILKFYNLGLYGNILYNKKCRLIENRFVCINALIKNGGEHHGN